MSLREAYLVPEHLREGLERYIEQGVPPGHFLTAVIENNLVEAFGRGDEESLSRLRDLVIWFYNYSPSPCWGSPEKRLAWQQAHAEQRKAVTP